VTEVEKELPGCDFDEHHYFINASTPYPRQRGTLYKWFFSKVSKE
jgi:hypothetical protein